MAKLSIITVTYNSAELITKLLNSLSEVKAEVVVVDSGSTDQTVSRVKRFKRVKLIETGENVGFGRGSNLGAKEASGEYLLFLNPDTFVEEGAIEQLLSYLETHPKVGIVGPKLVEESGRTQLSVRRLPTLWGAIQEYYFGVKNSYSPYAPEGDQPIEVESVVGAVVLIKKSLFEKIGGFDSKYFMYYEDLELCRQVRLLGYSVVYLPTAIVKHKVGGSLSAQKTEWIYQSSLKYHGWLSGQILHLILRFRLIH